MLRDLPDKGQKLESLLDERDHLCVTLNLANDSGQADPDQIKAIRLRLALLSHEIDDQWRAASDARKPTSRAFPRSS